MCTMCIQIAQRTKTCAFADNDPARISTGSMFAAAPVASLNELSDFLVEGFWGSVRSFDTSGSNIISVDLSALNHDGRILARAALESWEMVADIDFRETTGNADITFDDSGPGAFAGSLISGSTILSSTVGIATEWLDRYGTSLDSYAFQTYIHEIGHALGLGHMGDYSGGADYSTDATFRNDSWSVSVMSYFNQTENVSDPASYARLSTAMIADIAAIQSLYGAAQGGSATAGDTVYGVGSTLDNYLGDIFRAMSTGQTNALYTGNALSYTIWDSGGIDTIDYSFTNTDNVIRLGAQARSNVDGGIGNITLARGTLIENATSGAGNDLIQGNHVANVLRAGAGHDTVYGYGGNDLIFGGQGNDIIHSHAGDDTVHGGAGQDVIWAGAGRDVVLGGHGDDILGGGAGNDRVFGGQGNDTIYGGAGDDILGGGDGDDVIFGGGGADTIYGGDGNDVAGGGGGNDVVYTGSGNDTVYGGNGNDVLGAGTGDDLIYAGNGHDIVYGGAGHDVIYGGAGNDTLWGGLGDDTIHASSGADVMTGGGGADTFWFTGGADTITDFEIGIDIINLSRIASIAGFADLISNHLVALSQGARIEAGNGDSLFLAGIDANMLDANDFVF